MLRWVMPLTKASERPIIDEIYTTLWNTIKKPAMMDNSVPAHVSKSGDRTCTKSWYINYNIWVRGAIEPVQPILNRRELSFQNIMGLDAKNSDIASLFNQWMANFPVFIVVAGYSSGGNTHSFIMSNINNSLVLKGFLRVTRLYCGSEPEFMTTTMFKKSTVWATHTIDTTGQIQSFFQML